MAPGHSGGQSEGNLDPNPLLAFGHTPGAHHKTANATLIVFGHDEVVRMGKLSIVYCERGLRTAISTHNHPIINDTPPMGVITPTTGSEANTSRYRDPENSTTPPAQRTMPYAAKRATHHSPTISLPYQEPVTPLRGTIGTVRRFSTHRAERALRLPGDRVRQKHQRLRRLRPRYLQALRRDSPAASLGGECGF